MKPEKWQKKAEKKRLNAGFNGTSDGANKSAPVDVPRRSKAMKQYGVENGLAVDPARRVDTTAVWGTLKGFNFPANWMRSDEEVEQLRAMAEKQLQDRLNREVNPPMIIELKSAEDIDEAVMGKYNEQLAIYGQAMMRIGDQEVMTATEVKERQTLTVEKIQQAIATLKANNGFTPIWEELAEKFIAPKIVRPSELERYEDPAWTTRITNQLSSLNADTRGRKPGDREMALADQYTQELQRRMEELKRRGAPDQVLEREAERFFKSAPDWMKDEVREVMQRGMAGGSGGRGRFEREDRPREDRGAAVMALKQAKEQIAEMEEILTRIKDDALVLYRIDRMDKDGKFAYVKKGDMDLRVKAPPKLERGDEVLLHPKTFQIVEHLGKPPLEASPFSPSEIPNVTWDDIGGLEAAKADMIEAIEMPHKFKELFAYYKKRPIKGILLSGPPGCGKTMLGKAAARSLATIYSKESVRSGFLYVKGPEILNMFVGQTEQTIRDIFFDADRHHKEHGYPAVIFLDEADAILGARGQGNMSSLGSTIVPQFLTEMDGLENSSAIVIIATNRPDVLDPAIVRDGRCDRKISVTRPDEQNAVKILSLNLARCPVAAPDTHDLLAKYAADQIYDLERYIKSGKRLSTVVNGAMLANVVDLAVSFAIRRDTAMSEKTGLTKDDFAQAVEMITEQQATVRHDLEVEA